MSQEGPNSQHLDEVISCVKQISHRQSQSTQPASKLENLYGEAGELIKNFESNINRCKRYNQAKINRKYEMIIQELEAEVRKLNNKLKIQQDARSPTKRHVSDILDQLVVYKEENEQLKRDLAQTRLQLSELQNKSDLQVAAIKKMQNTQPKALIQRLPALSANTTVTEAIKQYLKDKENVRKVVSNTEKSNLEKFLHQNQAKSWNWTIGNLLEELDKWSEGIRPSKQVDMWRIRSSVARSFSEYLDDSETLTRPASFTKNMLSPIASRDKKQFSKKESRFSVFGDRSRDRSILDTSIH